MTRPKPMTTWQQELPDVLPRHVRRNIIDGPDGCWLWTRSLSRDGYGWASHEDRTHQAHRLVYRLVRGAPPEGLVLDHLCRVRKCVNPDHLEPVTNRENLRRGDTPTGMETCRKGHPLSPMRGQRRCMICLAAYDAGRRETKRLAERARRARIREESSSC